MARKTTTKAFRERAVAMVISGKTTDQVAAELGVEQQKIRRWFNNALSNSASINPGMFDGLSAHPSRQPPKKPSTKHPAFDKEKRRLEQENKHLKELVCLGTQWLSSYIAMQTEYKTGH